MTHLTKQTRTDTQVNSFGALASKEMSIDQGSLARLMETLSNIYSDPVLAIIREYSCNAWDSHQKAKSSSPVKITLPSTHNNFNFIVEDEGVGLSEEEIFELYTMYGKSTKVEDLDQVGAFGLGSKSALTLVDTFSMEAVKDGQKVLAVIAKNDRGVGQVDIAFRAETSEPNGVRIAIPIPSHYLTFEQRAKDFFQFWDRGSVLVNGEEPESIFDVGNGWSKIDTDPDGRTLFRTKDDGYSHRTKPVKVLVGNTTYSITHANAPQNRELNELLSIPAEVIVEVPIGSVDLTPSREELRFSNRTLVYLVERLTRAKASILEHIATRLNEIEDLKHFYAFIGSIPASLLPESLTWQGEEIPHAFFGYHDPESDPSTQFHAFGHVTIHANVANVNLQNHTPDTRNGGRGIRRKITKDVVIRAHTNNFEIYIISDVNVGYSSVARYLKEIFAQGVNRVGHVYWTDASITPDEKWLNTDLVTYMDYEDLKAMAKTARAKKGKPIKARSVERKCPYVRDRYETPRQFPIKDLESGVFYFSPHEAAQAGLGSVYHSTGSLHDYYALGADQSVVVLRKNMVVERFLDEYRRTHPDAAEPVSIVQRYKDKVNEIYEKLTPPAAIVFNGERTFYQVFRSLFNTEVDISNVPFYGELAEVYRILLDSGSVRPISRSMGFRIYGPGREALHRYMMDKNLTSRGSVQLNALENRKPLLKYMRIPDNMDMVRDLVGYLATE